MSEPVSQPPLDWNDLVDWDACYDPTPVSAGMGQLQGRLTSTNDGATIFLDPTFEANSNNDRNEFACNDCGYTKSGNFNYYYLNKHAKDTGHLAFRCQRDACNEAFISYEEQEAHRITPHIIGHSRIQNNGPFHCIQCNETLRSKPELLRHAQEMQHRPYSCECGSLFSRLDVLNRHLRSFGTDLPEYPCAFCRRHRGENGFRRQDHFLQHMRNYHHHEIGNNLTTASAATNTSNASTTKSRLKYVFPVCSQLGCPMYRGPEFQQLPRSAKEAGKPFATQSEYTKHMREEHEQCPFNCDIAGCARTGRRGYFREKDLIKHRYEQHPDAPPYLAIGRETSVRCTEAGCDAVLHPSSMTYHIASHEYQKRRLATLLIQPNPYV